MPMDLSTSCLTLVSRRQAHATLLFLLSSSSSSSSAIANPQDQMKPTKNSPKRTRSSSRNSPPRRGRGATFPPDPEASSSALAPSAALLNQEAETSSSLFFDNSFDDNTAPSPNSNPRSFPYSVKQQCWDKAEKIKGRDPDRWRRDALGNIVFRKLVGCPGCLCHDYDHILPYSKGGKSTLENCQVLQATVNRSKGNQTDISRAELIRRSSYCRVSGRDMDLLELSAFGNVRRAEDSGGGCRIQ